MSDCECLATCAFFNDKMGDMPAMADMYKRNYCQGDSTNCARHMVFEQVGPGTVPINLFPNQQEAARQLIAEKAY